MTNKAPAPAIPHRDMSAFSEMLYIEWNDGRSYHFDNITNFIDGTEYIEFISSNSETEHANIRVYKKEIRLLVFL